MAKISNLPEIERRINKYFGLRSTKDYITKILTSNSSERGGQATAAPGATTPPTPPPSLSVTLNKFIGAMLDQTGGRFTADIARLQKNLPAGNGDASAGQNVSNNVKIFLWDAVTGTEGVAPAPYIKDIIKPLISTDTTPAEHNPAVSHRPLMSVIFIRDNRISPITRKGSAIALFLNAIPTLEFSRALPFLDIEILTNRTAINETTNKLQTISLHKYLAGAKVIPPGSKGRSMVEATNDEGRFMRSGKNVQDATQGKTPAEAAEVTKKLGSSGMEIFLSPQTLAGSGENTSVEVIDKFRPFLSIKSFDVSVTPAAGIMSYKSGKLNLVLHDRSRLHEIADLVNPDLYGRIELYIQYGWRHPDTDPSQNIYGALLNEFQVGEKYGISNSSFNFDETGQVNVDLEIYMKGGRELQYINILENTKIRRIGDFIRDTKRVINELMRQAGLTQDQVKAIGGQNFLDGSERVALSLNTSLIAQYGRLLGRLPATGPASELKAELQKLYGEKGEPGEGEVAKMTSAISEIWGNRLKIIKDGSSQTRDPFLVDGPPNAAAERTLRKAGSKGNVSLAKLILCFIGMPLRASGESRFDEMQFIYYNFNNNCAGASNTNVGSFRINVEHFSKLMTHVQNTRQSTAMQIGEFIGLLNAEFINSMASETYDLGDYYSRSWNSRDKEFETKQKRGSRTTNAAIFNGKLEKAFRDKGDGTGTFKQPSVGFHVESVPETPRSGENSTAADRKTILRIHVFDRSNTPYATENQLLRANDSGQIAKMISDFNAAVPGRTVTQAPPNKAAAAAAGVGNRTVTVPATAAVVSQVGKQRAYALIQEATKRGILSHDAATNKYTLNKGKGREVKALIMNSVPSIIYGSNATAVKKAQLQSQQNPQLNTVHMMRNERSGWTDPEGEGPMGLPMRMIPTTLSLDLFGCPLLEYMQEFFVDFRTGTTVDGIYQVSEISHVIGPGNYQTTAKLINIDKYGKYESLYRTLEDALKAIDESERATAAAAAPAVAAAAPNDEPAAVDPAQSKPA